MEIDFSVVARGLHLVGVVLWIGGVAMVTTVLLPAVRRMKRVEERVQFFEQVEQRFAKQARITTLLTGLTGFYMLYTMDGWSLFSTPGYWWLHAMVAVWALFTVILFVLEPLILHRLFKEKAITHPEGTFRFMQKMHWVLLTVSLVTVMGAVLGAHGLLLVF
ncbi:hypothetical protein [Magnetococcus sp. PR-3]|uniref:hypothetical protein n=1 Tax=Magnetococcus sp. PR-3 TaxID=3120355 RepID=UPI002FCE4C53